VNENEKIIIAENNTIFAQGRKGDSFGNGERRKENKNRKRHIKHTCADTSLSFFPVLI